MSICKSLSANQTRMPVANQAHTTACKLSSFSSTNQAHMHTQVAPLHPGLFSRRGRYLTCTQGRKCGIPRCVWDRGTRKHPGAGFAIPCFGDADDHFFFRVRCPPKKAPPGGLCKEESCPRVILDSFLIQEFGISRHMPTVFDSTLPPPP